MKPKAVITITVTSEKKGLNIHTTIKGRLSSNDLLKTLLSFANSVSDLIQDMGVMNSEHTVKTLKRVE